MVPIYGPASVLTLDLVKDFGPSIQLSDWSTTIVQHRTQKPRLNNRLWDNLFMFCWHWTGKDLNPGYLDLNLTTLPLSSVAADKDDNCFIYQIIHKALEFYLINLNYAILITLALRWKVMLTFSLLFVIILMII